MDDANLSPPNNQTATELPCMTPNCGKKRKWKGVCPSCYGQAKKLIDDEMRRLITSREIYPIYDKWFNSPIPPGNTVLHLPVSYLLRDFWKYPTDQVPF